MKKFLLITSVFLLVLGTSGLASADLFLDEKWGSWWLGGDQTVTWNFDLDADTAMDADDVITSAYFGAAAIFASGDEAKIGFDYAGNPKNGLYEWSWGGILVNVLTEVVDDHYLTVKMKAKQGDSFKVYLAGVGGEYKASVPEPSTMLLLGFGLLGLAGAGRKKFLKK